jgi:lipopolysaccharide transport system ATP-binding protein
MGDVAIRAESLSKHYKIMVGDSTIGAKLPGQNLTLSHNLVQGFKNLWRFNSRLRVSDLRVETIWPLKDVSFEIKQGEVVGIIGSNGAGKSTLLKVLTRVTEPTSGRALVNGRVGSLLEVGTGFHPDLTGRENIYLSGTILGMKKTEIDQRFDEMVAFADIEKFIDTPVKRYSSGMYVRLAFSVGAHLQPEILIVDEVLAVGDTNFQKKCLDKMQDAGKHGRTVLFVSHHMQSIARLCDRAILLHEGSVLRDGSASEVISDYMNSGLGISLGVRRWDDLRKAPGTEVIRLRAVRIKKDDGMIAEVVDIRESVQIEMEYDVLKAGLALIPHFSVHNEEGIQLFSAVDNDPAWRGRPRPIGRYISTSFIPGNFFAEGMIVVGAAINTLRPNILQFHARDAVSLKVIDHLGGDSARGDFSGKLNGVVMPLLKWNTNYSAAHLDAPLGKNAC